MSASTPIDSASTTFRFSELPEDIGRVIFEVVADNGWGPCCALVSKKIRACKSQDFFAAHVKVVILVGFGEVQFPHDTMTSFIEACPGLQTLALWDFVRSRETQEFLTSLRLAPSRLSVIGGMFSEDEYHFHHPIFQNVTHLEFFWEDEYDWSWDSLSQLKRLTHLSLQVDLRFGLPNFVEAVRDVISACPPCLRILVIWVDANEFFCEGESAVERLEDIDAICRGEADPRAVVAHNLPGLQSEQLIQRHFEDYLCDWVGTSAPGEDFWAQAEKIIEGRKHPLTPA
ncbi:hypothetical protein H1R20_g13611, partial [Candolleomyces eurysporus]